MPKFIPQRDEKEVISLRLPKLMIEELDEKSSRLEISRNELIVQSIRFALDNLGNEEETN